MESKSYVGITGPVSKEEVLDICKLFEDFGFYENSSVRPMIGILASYKTLNNIKIENRRYPELKIIPELIKEMKSGTFRTIHYNTREFESLSKQVSELISFPYHKNSLDGIQLNMTYPPIDQIEKIKREFPKLEIIFQANSGVLNSGSKKEVAKRINNYSTLINYVLIDASGGKGEGLDIAYSADLANEIKDSNPSINIGFAGGFKGSNIKENYNDLINKCGGFAFSIDAEGGLRDKLSEKYGDDLLNINKVREYIQSASSILI
jgi:phosphoribosylanthranilate isomerase